MFEGKGTRHISHFLRKSTVDLWAHHVCGTSTSLCETCWILSVCSMACTVLVAISKFTVIMTDHLLLVHFKQDSSSFTLPDDNSSVSGSDSESESTSSNANTNSPASDLFAAATRHCKAFFTNARGQVFCIYRCLLHHRKVSSVSCYIYDLRDVSLLCQVRISIPWSLTSRYSTNVEFIA